MTGRQVDSIDDDVERPMMEASINLGDGRQFSTTVYVEGACHDPQYAYHEAVLDLLQEITQFFYESGLVISMDAKGQVGVVLDRDGDGDGEE